MPDIARVACASADRVLFVAWRRARVHDGDVARAPAERGDAALEEAPISSKRDSGRVAHARGPAPGAATVEPHPAREPATRPHRAASDVSSPMPDLRPAWPRRGVAAAWTLCAAGARARHRGAGRSCRAAQRAADDAGTKTARRRRRPLRRARGHAPPYTGLSRREVGSLDARRLPAAASHGPSSWTVSRSPASLAFTTAAELPLRAERRRVARRAHARDSRPLSDWRWTARRPSRRISCYRIDAVPDRAPEISVRAPGADAQHACAGPADMGRSRSRRATTTASAKRGSRSRSRRAAASRSRSSSAGMALDGGRDPRRRHYARTLDLARARLRARATTSSCALKSPTTARPKPNVARQRELHPALAAQPSDETAGMEGIVQRAMPAYFRSQRQIIIDTEALIAERAAEDAQRFEARSDELGVDQRILRLRYGQFLGEEFESDERSAEDRRPGKASAPARRARANSATCTTKPRPRRCSTPQTTRAAARRARGDVAGRAAPAAGASPIARCRTSTRRSSTSSRCSRRSASISRASAWSCRSSTRRAASAGERAGLSDRSAPPAGAGERSVDRFPRMGRTRARSGRRPRRARRPGCGRTRTSMPDAIGLWSAIARPARS